MWEFWCQFFFQSLHSQRSLPVHYRIKHKVSSLCRVSLWLQLNTSLTFYNPSWYLFSPQSSDTLLLLYLLSCVMKPNIWSVFFSSSGLITWTELPFELMTESYHNIFNENKIKYIFTPKNQFLIIFFFHIWSTSKFVQFYICNIYFAC